MQSKVQFAKDFESQIQATATKMENEKLDVCEIPNADGMVLVRRTSAECRRRLNNKSGNMMLPFVTPDGKCDFIVSAC